MSDWKVELVDDNISEFHVRFFGGPKTVSVRSTVCCYQLDCKWLFVEYLICMQCLQVHMKVVSGGCMLSFLKLTLTSHRLLDLSIRSSTPTWTRGKLLAVDAWTCGASSAGQNNLHRLRYCSAELLLDAHACPCCMVAYTGVCAWHTFTAGIFNTGMQVRVCVPRCSRSSLEAEPCLVS